MTAAVAGKGGGIITVPEARVMIGLPPNESGGAGLVETVDPADPDAGDPTEPEAEPDDDESEDE